MRNPICTDGLVGVNPDRSPIENAVSQAMELQAKPIAYMMAAHSNLTILLRWRAKCEMQKCNTASDQFVVCLLEKQRPGFQWMPKYHPRGLCMLKWFPRLCKKRYHAPMNTSRQVFIRTESVHEV